MPISVKSKHRVVSKTKLKVEKSAKSGTAKLRAGELSRASAPAVAARGKVITKAPVAVEVETHPAYEKAVEFLMSHTDYEKMRVVRYNTTTFNLDRMRTLLKHLGNPQTAFKTAHIAGTKGKGSTCHMLAGMLQAGGVKTGLYTSPHLVDMRERIRINGEMISRDNLVALVKRVEPVLKRMAHTGLKPTFFEIFTAMSFCYFADEKVELAVIETGMGGRLDSTNVITPEVTAITNISKD